MELSTIARHQRLLCRYSGRNHAIKLAGIVDLYSSLAFGEDAGVYLPNLCANPRRAMYQTRSNGDAAPAPIWWCRCRLGSDSHLIPSLE
ncbi:hypothetical protein POTOM_001912 [Populus tomentosa]|uniref:Uncharacterized protein n=1 Tax=Populus tomentosa TaxID=118781 RepID=A0A8X8IZ68_POPTO|nr:hypothetical protein POTOM_001912 [Populus tomentosa]